MQKAQSFLSIDLGAESGRAILGSLDESLTLHEIYRFPNGPISLPDGLHWDVLRLWSEIKNSIGLAVSQSNARLSGIGLDTWGVDFALLDASGALLANPYHYRDSRTDGILEEAFKRVSPVDIFANTGIQFMQINTLYQLLAMKIQGSPFLEIAKTVLMMPNLFHYWLSGEKACEFTITTTSQCYNPIQRDWAWSLLKAFGIPLEIFPKVIPPGTVLGTICPYLSKEFQLHGVPIIAPACHDTASAVAAIPAQNDHFAWISSGTWSIMGIESPEPVINEETLKYNFTNEGGVANKWRLSRTITGLWLVQECRRTWAALEGSLSYDEITHWASEAEPFFAFIDPDDSEFLKPGDMPQRIQAYCRKSHQRIPESKGAIIRCILESLALKYRWVLERLEEISGRRFEPIHMIGGGIKNHLLNQFTADATGRVCISGPVEATAIGNVIMQAIALKQIGSLAEARNIVRRSFATRTHEPHGRDNWDEAYANYLHIVALKKNQS
jgi:rhamnulokinase